MTSEQVSYLAGPASRYTQLLALPALYLLWYPHIACVCIPALASIEYSAAHPPDSINKPQASEWSSPIFDIARNPMLVHSYNIK